MKLAVLCVSVGYVLLISACTTNSRNASLSKNVGRLSETYAEMHPDLCITSQEETNRIMAFETDVVFKNACISKSSSKTKPITIIADRGSRVEIDFSEEELKERMDEAMRVGYSANSFMQINVSQNYLIDNYKYFIAKKGDKCKIEQQSSQPSIDLIINEGDFSEKCHVKHITKFELEMPDGNVFERMNTYPGIYILIPREDL